MLKVVSGHPNYCVDEHGIVRRIMLPGLYSTLIPDLSNGYARVDLDGKKEYIARLVLDAFDPTDDQSLKVFYIDGNKMNCRLSNLVWLSPSDIQLYSNYTIEYRMEKLSRGAR